MLEAMCKARVGDDVFGEDPSVNELETRAAAMFGMEAALYSVSGTMSNQIGIKSHTQPGDEVICDATSHIYQYEGGGIAFNSGASVQLIQGNLGKITAEQVVASINPEDVHKPHSSLVSLENTANRGGGSCYDIREIEKIRTVCNEHSLKLHLDGARLFNALVAKSESPKAYGKLFHSISVCLNKGLGCPVGSILLGSKEYIRKARRIRKVFGGGMRQAGFMAATGLYALNHHIERLKEDHDNAKRIAGELCQKKFVGEILPVETNIIIFSLKEKTPAEFVQALKKENILVLPMSTTQVRMVLHLDVTKLMVEQVRKVIKSL
jgi:threonine aldolase